MSTNHRLIDATQPQNIYRLKTYSGVEYHIVAADTYEALEKFRSHPMFDTRLLIVAHVAKLDM